jgi:hypothetical protein
VRSPTRRPTICPPQLHQGAPTSMKLVFIILAVILAVIGLAFLADKLLGQE